MLGRIYFFLGCCPSSAGILEKQGYFFIYSKSNSKVRLYFPKCVRVFELIDLQNKNKNVNNKMVDCKEYNQKQHFEW